LVKSKLLDLSKEPENFFFYLKHKPKKQAVLFDVEPVQHLEQCFFGALFLASFLVAQVLSLTLRWFL
jgi:hypothetical protein